MNTITPKFALLATALAFLLPAAHAIAQASAPKPATAPKAATDRELATAHAELARAAARVAELSQPDSDSERVRIEQHLVRKPVIGVLLTPDAQAGVRIAGVTPDSAAAGAGLRSGDRLVSIDGSHILGSGGELRVENARKLLSRIEADKPVRLGYMRDGRSATVAVTPKVDARVFMLNDADGSLSKFGGPVVIRRGRDGKFDIAADSIEVEPSPGITQEIRRELSRLRPGHCRDKDCQAPILMEAFRWNGLNLASVDPQLGRYFGADRGVLVLSNGELDGLQAGDILQRVDGKAVDTPRDVMAALRGKPADARVPVRYLRDRKSVDAQITVPKLMPSLMPPAPPAPPKPPKAPAPPATALLGDTLQMPPLAVAPPPPAPPIPIPILPVPPIGDRSR